jgi:mannitol-specific phosphotransferase system IIBC component
MQHQEQQQKQQEHEQQQQEQQKEQQQKQKQGQNQQQKQEQQHKQKQQRIFWFCLQRMASCVPFHTSGKAVLSYWIPDRDAGPVTVLLRNAKSIIIHARATADLPQETQNHYPKP